MHRRRQMVRLGYCEDFSMAFFIRFLIVVFLLASTLTWGNNKPVAEMSVGAFDKACRFVYEGEFDSAAELIALAKESTGQHGAQEVQYIKLAEITEEFARLEQKRQSAKKQQYENKLSKLKSLSWGADANDANDVNSPAEVFAVTGTHGTYCLVDA